MFLLLTIRLFSPPPHLIFLSSFVIFFLQPFDPVLICACSYPLPPCTLLPERAMWISLSKSIDLSSSSDSSRVQSHSAKVNIHLGSPNGKKMISVPAIASFSRPDTENVVSIGKVSDWTLPHLLTEFAVQQVDILFFC